MFSFKRADISEIGDIQTVARQTWPETYEPILGKEQVDYMLKTLYSDDVLRQQFEDGYFFYFIYQNDNLSGFAAFSELSHQVWKLHKIYILPQQQGSGAGKALLQFTIRKVISLGASQLLLNVNRFNKAKSFYEKNGFEVIEETDIDVGNGFYMNDYIMKLDLAASEQHRFY